MDPVWMSVALSGLAALVSCLAAYGALRPKAAAADPLLADALDDLGRDLGALRTALAEDGRRAREEASSQARGLREELQGALGRLAETIGQGLDRHGAGQQDTAKALREEVASQVRTFGELLGKTLEGSAAAQKERLDAVGDVLRRLVQTNADAHGGLRETVEARLETLRSENAKKLEEMRRTVDEKLQGTLEERLGEKFKLVSEQLAHVHDSVGEMRGLAAGVGDLKRVLGNVKSRGTWAEVSLGVLLEEALAPDQFDRNVETVPGSGERVEYAVRFPGGAAGEIVWLPIDAKFPIEDYERLLEASDRADAAAVDAALKGLEARIKLEGQKICGKYVRAPHTTDFAILYLPTEGLYAEVLRRPGLVDHLQGQCRILLAGPTNLHAFLISLRVGFRTLAIEKRSADVWRTLAEVKSEFAKYGDVLDAVKKKLEQATKQIDDVGIRKRAIDRKLRGVEELPDPQPALALVGPGGRFLDAAE